MGQGITLVGDLGKPATALIEKISGAIGTLYRPHQIINEAKAEAEASRIRAIANLEITGFQMRGMLRMIEEEGKKQENIENITSKALPDLTSDAKPQEVEDDWISNFFEKCKHISNEEMQSLWAKILAGESNKPGTFSKRTIELVSTLDRKDADLFTKLCRFAWMIGGVTLLVFDTEDAIFNKHDITFGDLTHLDSLGLIRFDSTAGFALNLKSVVGNVYYYGTQMVIDASKMNGRKLSTGQVLLSNAGSALAPICGSERIEDFPSYVVKQWAKEGVISWSPWHPSH